MTKKWWFEHDPGKQTFTTKEDALKAISDWQLTTGQTVDEVHFSVYDDDGRVHEEGSESVSVQ